MMHVVQAIELEAIGVFKDAMKAERFNKSIGDTLQLYPVRTALPSEVFRNLFFSGQAEGAYLEKCCGKGNVYIKVKKSLFNGLHCVSGPYQEKHKLSTVFQQYEKNENLWTRPYYKTTMLLSIDEIIKHANHPFQVIYVRGFGLVNENTIDTFKAEVSLNFASDKQLQYN